MRVAVGVGRSSLMPLTTLPVQGWGDGGCDLRRRPKTDVYEVQREAPGSLLFKRIHPVPHLHERIHQAEELFRLRAGAGGGEAVH